MTTWFAGVEQQAQTLHAEERVKLVDLPLVSLAGGETKEIARAWDDEISARVAALKNGTAILHPAAAVFAEARRACR